MKKFRIKTITAVMLGISVICMNTSCNKGSSNTVLDPGTTTHNVNQALVGAWMWTDGSDGGYYDSDGTYTGSAYGLATQYTIGANGYGSCFSHVYSTLGGSTGFEVNISSKGFFETDDQGHLGYFPTSGTYKTSNGTDRNLTSAELYNVNTKTGKSFVFQKLTVTTQGNRICFQVTATDGTVDTYFKQ